MLNINSNKSTDDQMPNHPQILLPKQTGTKDGREFIHLVNHQGQNVDIEFFSEKPKGNKGHLLSKFTKEKYAVLHISNLEQPIFIKIQDLTEKLGIAREQLKKEKGMLVADDVLLNYEKNKKAILPIKHHLMTQLDLDQETQFFSELQFILNQFPRLSETGILIKILDDALISQKRGKFSKTNEAANLYELLKKNDQLLKPGLLKELVENQTFREALTHLKLQMGQEGFFKLFTDARFQNDQALVKTLIAIAKDLDHPQTDVKYVKSMSLKLDAQNKQKVQYGYIIDGSDVYIRYDQLAAGKYKKINAVINLKDFSEEDINISVSGPKAKREIYGEEKVLRLLQKNEHILPPFKLIIETKKKNKDKNLKLVAIQKRVSGDARDLYKASPTQILTTLTGVVKALVDLHNHSIVHSDIKPANMLYKGNKGYLHDFGLSIQMYQDSIGASKGYLPPEIYNIMVKSEKLIIVNDYIADLVNTLTTFASEKNLENKLNQFNFFMILHTLKDEILDDFKQLDLDWTEQLNIMLDHFLQSLNEEDRSRLESVIVNVNEDELKLINEKFENELEKLKLQINSFMSGKVDSFALGISILEIILGQEVILNANFNLVKRGKIVLDSSSDSVNDNQDSSDNLSDLSLDKILVKDIEDENIPLTFLPELKTDQIKVFIELIINDISQSTQWTLEEKEILIKLTELADLLLETNPEERLSSKEALNRLEHLSHTYLERKNL